MLLTLYRICRTYFNTCTTVHSTASVLFSRTAYSTLRT